MPQRLVVNLCHRKNSLGERVRVGTHRRVPCPVFFAREVAIPATVAALRETGLERERALAIPGSLEMSETAHSFTPGASQ